MVMINGNDEEWSVALGVSDDGHKTDGHRTSVAVPALHSPVRRIHFTLLHFLKSFISIVLLFDVFK